VAQRVEKEKPKTIVHSLDRHTAKALWVDEAEALPDKDRLETQSS
jgi:hypothetical protein